MCLTPVTIRRTLGAQSYLNQVPCNHCLECVKDKQNEYIIRTIEEQRKKGTMVFFTLTYNPDALPMTEDFELDEETGEILKDEEVQTLRRADVTLWLRLFRQKYKRQGIKLDFSHLICGEYGPRTFRPHYHGIILGLTQEQVNDLMWSWKTKYGYVCFKFVPSLMADIEKVARYTAKYTVKNEEWNILPNEKCEKPRKMTSQFYGMPNEKRWKGMVDYYLAKDVCEYDMDNPKFENKQQYYKVVDEIIRRRKYRNGNGNEWKLPNYYRRKIFYVKDGDKVRASQIQRMVTFNVQRNFDKNLKEELHNLATIYNFRTYDEAFSKYQMVHDDDKFYRAKRYAESDKKYMVKSVY